MVQDVAESGEVYMSFGGGVQSTTLALLALNRDERLLKVTGGRIPALYLFADTGDERLVTVEHVERMRAWLVASGFAFEVLRRPQSLSEHVLSKARDGARGINMPPVFVVANDGRAMPVRRGCTAHFKVQLLDSHAKRVFKAQRKAGGIVTQWYGMSYDEPQRLRTAAEPWRRYAYPLYDMRWTRWHCEQYLATQMYPEGDPVSSVRSSCVYCPFHSDTEWRELRDGDPEGWARAIAFDTALRESNEPIAGLKSLAYVHRSRLPLGDVTLDVPGGQGDLFSVEREECHGVCGV